MMGQHYMELGEQMIAVAAELDLKAPANLNVGERQAWEAGVVAMIATFSGIDADIVADDLERARDAARIAAPLARLEQAFAS